jgi:hypothetical protein
MLFLHTITIKVVNHYPISHTSSSEIEDLEDKTAYCDVESQIRERKNMEIEPKQLVFRDVRINQAYTTSLCITNTSANSVEYHIISSSPRYTITPDKFILHAGQSIVASVRLYLNGYPSYPGPHSSTQEDSIAIKSIYFERRLSVSFNLHSRDCTTTASRSQSPNLRSNSADGQTSAKATQQIGSKQQFLELERQLIEKTAKVQQLELIIQQLESKHPSVMEIVRNRLEQERHEMRMKVDKVRYLRFRAIEEDRYHLKDFASYSSVPCSCCKQIKRKMM